MKPYARLLVLMIVGCAVATTGCGPDPLEFPPAPELSALAATYQSPPGTIDPAAIDQTLADARVRLEERGLAWLPELVADALTRLRTEFEERGLATDPAAVPDKDRPQVDAVIRLERTCKGWSDPPGSPNSEQNGMIELTVVVEKGSPRRSLTLAAQACKARLAASMENALLPRPIAIEGFVDGDLGVYLPAGLPATLDDVQALVALSGEFGVGGQTVTGELDFWLDYPHLSVRVPGNGGDVILTVGLDAVTLRGANGSYSCDIALAACAPLSQR